MSSTNIIGWMNKHMRYEMPGEQFTRTVFIVQKHTKINNPKLEKNARTRLIGEGHPFNFKTFYFQNKLPSIIVSSLRVIYGICLAYIGIVPKPVFRCSWDFWKAASGHFTQQGQSHPKCLICYPAGDAITSAVEQSMWVALCHQCWLGKWPKWPGHTHVQRKFAYIFPLNLPIKASLLLKISLYYNLRDFMRVK